MRVLLGFGCDAAGIKEEAAAKGERRMKRLVVSGIALAGVLSFGIGHAQTVGQDMKDAGHDTAHATRTVGHDTAHDTRVAARNTAHGTKVAAKDTVHGTKVVAKDTAHGTKVVARDTVKDTKKIVH